MIPDATLSAGVTALSLKAALAGWAAMLFLGLTDRRKSVTPLLLLLSLLVTLTSLRAATAASSSPLVPNAVRFADRSTGRSEVAWWLSTALGGVALLAAVRLWLRTTPTQLHDESRRQDPPRRKSGSTKTSRGLAVGTAESMGRAGGVGLLSAALGVLLTSYALIAGDAALQNTSNPLPAIVHMLASVMMGAVVLVCSVELTFLSAPDALNPKDGNRVGWSTLARLALAFWIVEFLVCTAVIVSPLDPGNSVTQQGIIRLFAFSLLILNWVAWMVPHRVAHFQKTGKATEWISLALAAWIAFIALAVACALPADWPWKHL